MSKKISGLVIAFLITAAVALWWSHQSASTPGKIVPTAKSTATKATQFPAKTPPPEPSGPETSKPATPSANVWSPALATSGAPLDLQSAKTTVNLGKVAVGLTALVDGHAVALEKFAQGSTIVIPLPGGLEAHGTVNFHQTDPNGTIRLGGSLDDGSRGSFSLGQTRQGVFGQVLLRQQKTAYLVSTLADRQIQIREVALASVICDPFPREAAPEHALAAPSAGPQAMSPELRSRPGTVAVLYLDFDGATVQDPSWNNGNSLTASPSGLSSSDITQVWSRVKEDFWPFGINVTTVESDYTSAPVGRRMRVIITPTDTASPGAGGVAYRDSFARAGTNYSVDIPCWVFNQTINGVAEAISHEAGHTFGLSHDGRTNPVEEYYAGHGFSSSNSWGPIMGASYNAVMTQWSKGEYPNANNLEDDVAIIAGTQATPLYGVINNTGYIPDDVGDSMGAATTLDVSSDTLSRAGMISSAPDADFYRFTVDAPKRISFSVTPANNYTKESNLDAQIELQDAAGTAVASENPDPGVNVTLVTTVPAGTYYLKVRGAAHAANPSLLDYGYSNYGSIGQYTLSGSLGPVVAPSISLNPQSQSVYAGNNLSLTAAAIGTGPFNYQWKRTGTPLVDDGHISGARTASLNIAGIFLGEAGQYTLTVSNAAGSVTTSAAAVTVTLPPLPVFSVQPSNTTVVQGNSFTLSTYIYNPVTINYQWYKNGVLLPGEKSSSLSRSAITFADAGSYYVTATNSAGTTTSSTAVVTIGAASLAVITTQPQGADLYMGQYYQLMVNATSNSPLTYQWFRNGVPISGAIYYFLNFSPATTANAGEYTVNVTNAAGTVSSTSALLTVSATLPPRITSQPSSQYNATIGYSTGFGVNAEGTGPLTYQWYRNGIALPGATYAYLNISQVAVTDIGEYYATVSNANGTVTSDTVILDLDFSGSNKPDSYWSEAREFDGVVYFLFKSTAKIARYDLATESWLPSWNLTYAPTAFTVSNDAVYIAFGVTVKKYSRTLGNETVLVNGPNSFSWLEVADNRLLTASFAYPYTTIATYNAATGAAISAQTFTYSASQGFSYSPVTKRIYGRSYGISPGDIYSIQINADGTVAPTSMDTPYHGSFSEGIRTFQLGGGSLLSDESGIVYETNLLSLAGSFGGRIRDALSDGASGYCTVNGTQVARYDAKLRQTGIARLSIFAARAWRKADAQGGSLLAFAQPTSTSTLPAVQKIAIGTIVPKPAGTPIRGYAQKIAVERIVADETGIVYIYSKELKQILRWSTVSHIYLPSIPLNSTPRYLAYSTPNRTLYFDNGSTQIKQVQLDAAVPAETPYYSATQNITGLQTAGTSLVFADTAGPWQTHYTVSPDGDLIDSADWNYRSREYAWSEVMHRMYFFRDDTTPNDLMYEAIATDGIITAHGDSPYHGEVVTNPPIRVAPDGSAVLLGSGQIYDGMTLNAVGTIAGTIIDAGWTGNLLHVMRAGSAGTKIQSYLAGSYASGQSVELTGSPVRLIPLAANRFLAITSVQGFLHYWELQADTLTVSSHVDTTVAPKFVASDLNADGRADILLQNFTTGQRRAWLLNGATVSSQVNLESLAPEWSVAAIADFNGDYNSDLLLQNRLTGERRIRLMQGTKLLREESLGTVALEWSIATAGDLNADGWPDIVWQNIATGARYVWFMNGTHLLRDASLGTLPVDWLVAAAADLNRDGRADLVWQHAVTGQRYVWFMDGTAIIREASLGTVAADWSIVGAADYNGDGNPDFLWQNLATSQGYVWYLNGTTVTSEASLGTFPLGWSIARPVVTKGPAIAGDIDGDGFTDLLWQNTSTGQPYVWLMDGDTEPRSDSVLPAVPAGWSIVASADFDQDGSNDLLMQNLTTGGRQVRLMKGMTVLNDISLGVVPTAWSMVAVGDFNGDQHPDIAWENTATGQRYLWFMSGTQTIGDANVGTIAIDWHIAASADLNGDGKSDLIWEHAVTGQRHVWFMSGGSVLSDASLGLIAADWHIAAAEDINGDGYVDLVWQHAVTGQRYVWYMKGTTVTGEASLGTVPVEWWIVN